jgi:hypothetical protein
MLSLLVISFSMQISSGTHYLTYHFTNFLTYYFTYFFTNFLSYCLTHSFPNFL